MIARHWKRWTELRNADAYESLSTNQYASEKLVQ
jgi:hypothetical protein